MKKRLVMIILLLNLIIPYFIYSAHAEEAPSPFDSQSKLLASEMDDEIEEFDDVEEFEESEEFDDFEEFNEFETFDEFDNDFEDVPADEIERARVIEVLPGDGPGLDEGFYQEIQTVRVEILSGDQEGEEVEAIHTLTGNPGSDFEVEPGDRILISVIEIGGESQVHIVEYERDRTIYIVLALFVILLILLGGLKGLKTILTLALTLFLLLRVLIPGLLAGYSPILMTILISLIITVVTILTVGGLNIKSIAAITGVLGGVLISGLIAYIVGNQINLTGLSGQEAMMLMFIPQNVDFNFGGLLFAGIIMGALGAVMDVGMSIASAMEEIRMADPTVSTKRLILSGMNVGKDIMGTMANTLILAYIGSMIPLLLLFTAYQEPFISIINMNVIATEVIRALAGSIGLVLSIPLTAVSSGLLRDKLKPQKVSLTSDEPTD